MRKIIGIGQLGGLRKGFLSYSFSEAKTNYGPDHIETRPRRRHSTDFGIFDETGVSAG